MFFTKALKRLTKQPSRAVSRARIGCWVRFRSERALAESGATCSCVASMVGCITLCFVEGILHRPNKTSFQKALRF